MSHSIDFPCVRFALDTLSKCSADAQLITLKNLCVNNGIWMVPENPEDFHPVIYEVSLFGVMAMTDTIEQLPAVWCKVAKNILKREPQQVPA